MPETDPSNLVSREGILRPHQDQAFQKTAEFIAQGGTEGYITLPTGTGKTVLFIEVAQAIRQSLTERFPEDRQKILVVVPRIFLGNQTIGSQDEKRGFAHFAPDLHVSRYYGGKQDMSGEIVVTTYQSLRSIFKNNDFYENADFDSLMRARSIGKPELPEEEIQRHLTADFQRWHDNSFRNIAAIIFDEAHHLIGPGARDLYSRLPEHIIKLGLTATPETTTGHLSEVMPNEIEHIELREAVESSLLSPMQLFAIRSGSHLSNMELQGDDYEEDLLKPLIEKGDRNEQAISLMRGLVENGLQGIVSCISGDALAHARNIAERANREIVTVNGEQRPMRVAVVGHIFTPAQNMQIFKAYERGEYDALTFTKYIGEGWDSQVTKFLINLAPSRSPKVVVQRLGRITRRQDLPRLAYVFDIVDDFDELPPLTAYDVLRVPYDKQGVIVANPAEADEIASVVAPGELAELKMPEYTYQDEVRKIAYLRSLGRQSVSATMKGSMNKTFMRYRSLANSLNLTEAGMLKLLHDFGDQIPQEEFVSGERVVRGYYTDWFDKAVKDETRFPLAEKGIMRDAEGRVWLNFERFSQLARRAGTLATNRLMDAVVKEDSRLMMIGSEVDELTRRRFFVELVDAAATLKLLQTLDSMSQKN